MVITYDPETKTVTMSLADLVHCGFNHDGLDDTIVPEKLVVDFSDASILSGVVWIPIEKYCTCRRLTAFVSHAGELRCQQCGRIVKYVFCTGG